MALSHRPLEDDELFQIKIDKLENDETVTPVLLHVGLVDDRSDNTQQWTLTSSHILYKGEKLQQFTKLDVDELKVIVNNMQTFKSANRNCLNLSLSNYYLGFGHT
jgi:hypothetical protein